MLAQLGEFSFVSRFILFRAPIRASDVIVNRMLYTPLRYRD